MPNPELQPTIPPTSELKHALTEPQTDYLEKLNKQLLGLTGGKGLEQLKLDDYPVETQEKILDLGETIEKVARGEIEKDPEFLTSEKIIQWAKEQIGKDKEWVDENFDFSELPKIKVKGFLDLRHCPNLKFLPDNLEVEGYLDLEHCIKFKSLPDNLKVEIYLDLRRCTNLESLPDNLEVWGNLYVSGCKESVKIKAQELKDGGQIKGEVIT